MKTNLINGCQSVDDEKNNKVGGGGCDDFERGGLSMKNYGENLSLGRGSESSDETRDMRDR